MNSIALGTCPTCRGSVSTNAEACPGCGETQFTVIDKVACGTCHGTGMISASYAKTRGKPALPNDKGEVVCDACNGTGKVIGKADLRVNRKQW